uniref:Uncharacterized protein n=1 Tax=Trichuris muris TaxID=70415 RepID=A0A5S6QNF1_TRIMR
MGYRRHMNVHRQQSSILIGVPLSEGHKERLFHLGRTTVEATSDRTLIPQGWSPPCSVPDRSARHKHSPVARHKPSKDHLCRPEVSALCRNSIMFVWSDRWCGPTGGCRGHLAQRVWSDRWCGPTDGCRGQPARSMLSDRGCGPADGCRRHLARSVKICARDGSIRHLGSTAGTMCAQDADTPNHDIYRGVSRGGIRKRSAFAQMTTWKRLPCTCIPMLIGPYVFMLHNC